MTLDFIICIFVLLLITIGVVLHRTATTSDKLESPLLPNQTPIISVAIPEYKYITGVTVDTTITEEELAMAGDTSPIVHNIIDNLYIRIQPKLVKCIANAGVYDRVEMTKRIHYESCTQCRVYSLTANILRRSSDD